MLLRAYRAMQAVTTPDTSGRKVHRPLERLDAGHHPSCQSRRGQGTSEFIRGIGAKHGCHHGSVRSTSCGHTPCISISVVVCSVPSDVACLVLCNR